MLKKICLTVFTATAVIANANAVSRFVIQYKPTASQAAQIAKGDKNNAESVRLQMMHPLSSSTVNKLSAIAGTKVVDLHAVATGAHVIVLDKDLDPSEAKEFMNRVSKSEGVSYIEEDRLLKPTLAPEANPDWQWDMNSTGSFMPQPTWNGDNFLGAWNSLNESGYTPGNNVVVAVIDTGYTPHPNFVNSLQTLGGQAGVYGYQFISDCRVSGQCPPNTPTSLAQDYPYESNALDLGDFINIRDKGTLFFANCQLTNSSWHGSHVTGSVVASGYTPTNESYILGGAYGAKVVPVRALGKCGGYTSDIINGMYWAAGFSVPNSDNSIIPGSPTPAQVLNLSLGGEGGCSYDQQTAVDKITSNGTVIVVAAGNENTNIINSNPASCSNVIVVAAKGPTNQLAYYSNYGATTITASGGDRLVSGCSAVDLACQSGIYSTIWNSPESYIPESQGGQGIFATYQGTSMATPHVVAAVADMIGVLRAKNENYTTYGIAAVLQMTSQSYNPCSVYGCAESGALNADAAVSYLLNGGVLPTPPTPPTPPSPPTPSVGAGSGGGGCSAITNGNDFSLILLLLGSSLYAYRRRKNISSKSIKGK